MVQIKHFTAPQKKCQTFNFQDVQIGRGGTKYLTPPSAARQLVSFNVWLNVGS